jgi:hypothetical protein
MRKGLDDDYDKRVIYVVTIGEFNSVVVKNAIFLNSVVIKNAMFLNSVVIKNATFLNSVIIKNAC